MRIDWIELKLLDVATNHPSRTEMCRQLHSLGHEIRYYCGYRYSKREFPGLPQGIIHYLNAPRLKRIRGIYLVVKVIFLVNYLLWKKGTDILILDYLTNLSSSAFIRPFRILNKKTKMILDVRTLPAVERTFKRDIKIFHLSLKKAKKTCDGFTFISPAMKDYCRKNANLDGKPMAIWSSGVNEDIFDPDRYIKKKKENFELFYHGAISVGRGIKNLIEALAVLSRKYSEMTLTLVGQICDEEQIKKLIADRGLGEVCRIMNPVVQARIPQMIRDCDLPVIPLGRFRAWEVSSPLKLIEYLAMGKSVVLTDIEAHRAIAGSHPFAFYSRSDKPEDLAEAIEKAYLAKSKLEIFGRDARALAVREFTWKKQADRLVHFLASL